MTLGWSTQHFFCNGPNYNYLTKRPAASVFLNLNFTKPHRSTACIQTDCEVKAESHQELLCYCYAHNYPFTVKTLP